MRIQAGELERDATALLGSIGLAEEDAGRVASSLVAADLRGHTSHGVLRIPFYADLVDDGVIDPAAEPAVERESSTSVAIDGRTAFGQLVGRLAVDRLTELATRGGVGVVGMRDASHLGRVGEWAERTTDAGLLFAAFVNTQGGGFTVAPAGSAERKLATNPIAFGVPAFDALPHDVVLDVATSQVAHGKIRERFRDGEPIPEGWTTDESGEPFTDAAAFETGEGALLPLGGAVAGYKGFGLAVVAELFAGIVGDSVVAGERDATHAGNAAAFAAIDPLVFTDRAGVERRVAALADHLRDADYDVGPDVGVGSKGEGGMLPGEPEFRNRERYAVEGVPLSDGVVETLRDLADERGVTIAL